jgi:hypothetical protein
MSQLSPIDRRFNLAGWLDRHITCYSKSGNEWICDCPRCGRDKFAVNVLKMAFQCWVCGFRGRHPAVLVGAVLGSGPAEGARVVEQAAMGVGTHVEPLEREKASAAMQRLLPEAAAPPGTTWQLDGRAERYARERGISDDNCRLFGLSSLRGDRSGSKADRLLTGRLLIPVWDLTRRFVYWIARDTGASKIKVINLPAPDKHAEWGLTIVPGCATRNEVLVGLHLCRPGEPIYLVEGPLDAVVCGPQFVATMGSSLSLAQAYLLSSLSPSEVVVMYDGDDAGDKGGRAAAGLLASFLPVRVARCPSGTDPAELGKSACLELSANCPGSGAVQPLQSAKKSSNLKGLRYINKS